MNDGGTEDGEDPSVCCDRGGHGVSSAKITHDPRAWLDDAIPKLFSTRGGVAAHMVFGLRLCSVSASFPVRCRDDHPISDHDGATLIVVWIAFEEGRRQGGFPKDRFGLRTAPFHREVLSRAHSHSGRTSESRPIFREQGRSRDSYDDKGQEGGAMPLKID